MAFVKGNIPWVTGKHHTEKTKQKISNTLKGRVPWNKNTKGIMESNSSSFKKNHIPWNKGKNGCYTEEQMEKYRKSHVGNIPSLETRIKMGNSRRGKNNVNWKGGITPENKKIRSSLEMKEWRNAVFERDDYTCVRCLVYGDKLHAHHVFSFADFPEERFEIDNGATLCEPCHDSIRGNN